MPENTHPAVLAVIEELVKRGFYERLEDGRLKVLPKCSEPEHLEEFGQLLRESIQNRTAKIN